MEEKSLCANKKIYRENFHNLGWSIMALFTGLLLIIVGYALLLIWDIELPTISIWILVGCLFCFGLISIISGAYYLHRSSIEFDDERLIFRGRIGKSKTIRWIDIKEIIVRKDFPSIDKYIWGNRFFWTLIIYGNNKEILTTLSAPEDIDCNSFEAVFNSIRKFSRTKNIPINDSNGTPFVLPLS